LLTRPQGDLEQFHRHHLSAHHCPLLLQEEYALDGDGDDDDDLGYYADGNKRTLTDEQIAIFRHTEIQELLKMHEAASYDEIPSAIDGSNLANGAESAGISSTTAKSKHKAMPKVQDKKNGKRKRPNAPAGQDKRNDPKRYTTEGDERTFRRIAREMDEHKDTTVELDY
jgi:hypothetical protein